MRLYTITVDGIDNIAAAEKFIGNSCTRGIYNHGKCIATAEIVVPFGERGYTVSNNAFGLVSFAYIKPANVGDVIESLKRLGFSGLAFVCAEDENGCFASAVSGSEFCVKI